MICNTILNHIANFGICLQLEAEEKRKEKQLEKLKKDQGKGKSVNLPGTSAEG